jgi:hypothetical protein
MLRLTQVLLPAMLLAVACSRRPLASSTHQDSAAPADMAAAEGEVAEPLYRESTRRFVEISASGATACGITTEASVECWGAGGACRDRDGECPTAHGCMVKPTSGTWNHVSVDVGNGCAIDADSKLACWGCPIGLPMAIAGAFSAVHIPYAIRLDDGSLAALSPPQPQGSPLPPDSSFISVSGFQYYCGLLLDRSLACWGTYRNDGIAVQPPPSGTFLQVAVTNGFGCAIQLDGKVVCWGSTADWDSGDPRFVPFPGGTYTQIDAGGAYAACGVQADGTLACWGMVAEYPPPPEGQFLQVAVGGPFFCALRTDGIVVCWGENSYGESSPP